MRETYGNGFVYQIDALDLAGQLHSLWTGVHPAQPVYDRAEDNGWTATSVDFGSPGTSLGQYLMNGDKTWIRTDVAGIPQSSYEELGRTNGLCIPCPAGDP